MNRVLWILMLALLVGTAFGANWAFNHGANPFAKAAPPDPAAEAPPPPTVVALGLVDGDKQVAKLFPLGQGRVEEVIGEGTEVNKGDTLLRLEDRLAQATLDQAKADLKAAQEKHEQALDLPKQHELKLQQQEKAISAHQAKRKAIKSEQDLKLAQAKGNITVSQNVLDALEQSLKQADDLIDAEKLKLEEMKLFKPQSEINRALADVKAKEAQVAQAQWGLEQCRLEAPSEGLVLRVTVGPGEVLVPNLPGQSAPIQFLPKSPKIVRAEVLQEWAHLVKVGQEAEIEDDSYHGPTWKGKVRYLSYWFAEKRHRIIEPFMLNDVRTLECVVEVLQEDPILRIGQRVKVKIKTP
jgi:HlyD family secretion protein